MRLTRVILLIAVALVALSHRSDGQQARPVAEQIRLSAVMPRGAMVYVQARDLSSLMKTWLASAVRGQFYNSPSFFAFSQSRIYLKLQDRKKDFETAIGFGLDEGRLAELAGGASAIAIYDIGKLELVFATEVSRERAIATALFKQAPQFQERAADDGVYYVRDVTTDGGRLNQQFCFAHAGGKLIVTTTEGLMIRALRNVKSPAPAAPGSDALLPDVMATCERARGFTAHEVTMWLDQTRLNRNRHFNNYWVHGNVAESVDGTGLADIETGLVDLTVAPEGLNEQRWFTLKSAATASSASMPGEQAAALMRFAPADAHLIELHASTPASAGVSEAVSKALFGKLPGGSFNPPDIPDQTSSPDGEGTGRAERYSRLDARFDRDVDDDQTPDQARDAGNIKRDKPAAASERDFAKSVAPILAAVSSGGYCEVVRSKLDAGKPFASFERAVVVEMRAGASFDRPALERAITDEMRARFVVAGVDPKLAWQDEGAVRYLAQSLLEQGAAYSISGRYLVLASSRSFAGDIVRAASDAAAVTKIEGPVGFYALVRVADAKPVFDRLMAKLDGKSEADPAGQKDREEEPADVKFFSGNLSSLIAASAIREVRARRSTDGSLLVERIVYSW